MLQRFRSPLLLGALLLCTTGAFAGQAEVEQPNIIFIMVDDLGPEWISCYGAEGIETPNIDALAAGGMRFENAYSMPKCTPTRTTLLTGQYPFRHGWVNHWDVPRWGAGCHFDPKHNMSFARIMRDAGYATAIAGKWQINDFRVQPRILDEHGFDEWCMWTGYETNNPASAERYMDAYIHQHDTGSKTHAGRFGPDVYAGFLLDFIKRHRDEPLMIYYPMNLTHPPLVPTPAEPKAKGKMDKHRAMVRYVDGIVGRIVGTLEELGLRERTIIIFTTDNGTSKGIDGRLRGRDVKGGKGALSENGCRAPFIVNGPGMVPAGVVTEALTDFTDMLPTFAELGGARLPEGLIIDGHSIAPLLLGKQDESPREWILAMGGGVARIDEHGIRPELDRAARVLRDQRFKVWVDKAGKIEKLFDLASDPGEERNMLAGAEGEAAAALARFEKAASTFPEKDGRPLYDPTPAQSWDRKIKSKD